MSIERRRAVRHPIDLHVELDSGSGVTLDISGHGVLFESEVLFESGEQIDFTLMLPKGGEVRCRGTVVRTRAEGSRHLVAATIDGYLVQGAGSEEPHFVVEQLRAHQPEGWEWGE